jgi:hypothetical protein
MTRRGFRTHVLRATYSARTVSARTVSTHAVARLRNNDHPRLAVRTAAAARWAAALSPLYRGFHMQRLKLKLGLGLGFGV